MEVYCWKSRNICSYRVASEYSSFEWGKELSCVIGQLACKGRRATLEQRCPSLTYCFISSGLICSLYQLWKQRHYDITISLQMSSKIGKIWFISCQTRRSWGIKADSTCSHSVLSTLILLLLPSLAAEEPDFTAYLGRRLITIASKIGQEEPVTVHR